MKEENMEKKINGWMANPLGHRYAFISLWLWIKHL